MKFITSSSFFLLMLFFCSAYSISAAERFPFLAEISSDKVNIRAGQNVNFEKVASLNKGEAIIVYGQEFDWYKIQLPLQAKSYIRADYVAMNDGNLATVTGNSVNVRGGAGTGFTSVGQVKKGEQVKVIDKSGDWLQIEPMEGMFAWVKKEFVTLKSYDVPPLASLGFEEITTSVQKDIQRAQPTSSSIKIKISGKLEAVVEPGADISYRLTNQDQTIYYIQGHEATLSYFLNNQVTVEGSMPVSPETSLSYPILSVSKMTLVL